VSARAWLAAALLAAGCGSSSVSRPDPSPTPTGPPPPAIVVITANGVEPQVVHVWVGRRAFFENRDSQPHTFFSDPHPTHGECAGKLNTGAIQPGERREVSDLPFDACYFHDDSQPGARNFTGVLVVH
jgi:hypothetical protein